MKRTKKAPEKKGNHIHATLPWKCTCFGNQAEIEAVDSKTGQWETIALVNAIAGLDAEDVASFIVRIVNAHERTL